MDNLSKLNELSWILESLACDFTGEAKDSISYLQKMIDQENPVSIEDAKLYKTLDEITGLINNFKANRASRILTPIIRMHWNQCLSEEKNGIQNKIARQIVNEQLKYDSLTGAYSMYSYTKAKKLPYLIYVDHASMMDINLLHGIKTGDLVLQATAQALMCETDEVYRHYGDKFIVQHDDWQGAHDLIFKVKNLLKNKRIAYRDSNGEIQNINGIDIYYDVGEEFIYVENTVLINKFKSR